MSRGYCHGRECKLGWGYNVSLNRLVPVEGKSPNVTLEPQNIWKYVAFPLSSTIIPHWQYISLLSESTCKKVLDFRIVLDDNEYWHIHCYFYKRREGSKQLPKYPPNCSHFVRWISYGVDLWVQFPKTGFPTEKEEIVDLFKEQRFNEVQKKTKCRVLISYNETTEMNLENLLKFMKELDEDQHSQYDVPIYFECEKLDQRIRETPISNQIEFGIFLSYLYCVYRKIENKMEKANVPDIISVLEFEEKSLVKICFNLEKAKFDYKSMNKDDFLEMYPILKRLFSYYIIYIKYLIKNGINIDEGKYLPRTTDEMILLMGKLNNWFPINVSGEWVNCTSSFVAAPPGFEPVIETLHKITKFSNFPVVNDDTAIEVYIVDENSKKILFGFVDMEGAKADDVPDTSSLLELECPEECTQYLKKWICVKCGDFISQKDMTLFCACGSKRYKDKLLICQHRLPNSEEQEDQTFNYDNLLPIIYERLLKIRERNEGFTDAKIHYVIRIISLKRSEEEIKNTLKDLQGVDLDSHTEHIIELYLDRNN